MTFKEVMILCSSSQKIITKALKKYMQVAKGFALYGLHFMGVVVALHKSIYPQILFMMARKQDLTRILGHNGTFSQIWLKRYRYLCFNHEASGKISLTIRWKVGPIKRDLLYRELSYIPQQGEIIIMTLRQYLLPSNGNHNWVLNGTQCISRNWWRKKINYDENSGTCCGGYCQCLNKWYGQETAVVPLCLNKLSEPKFHAFSNGNEHRIAERSWKKVSLQKGLWTAILMETIKIGCFFKRMCTFIFVNKIFLDILFYLVLLSKWIVPFE